jgi:hypothetical protein
MKSPGILGYEYIFMKLPDIPGNQYVFRLDPEGRDMPEDPWDTILLCIPA